MVHNFRNHRYPGELKRFKIDVMEAGLGLIGVAAIILFLRLMEYYYSHSPGITDMQRAMRIIDELPFVDFLLALGLVLVWRARKKEKAISVSDKESPPTRL